MPTNAELSRDFDDIKSQFKELLSKLPTKDDLKELATKDDLKNLVTKDNLETFKDDFKKEMKDDVDTRFLAFKEEQNRLVEEKVKEELVEIKAKRLLDEKYNFRCNFLLIGVKEAEGSWKETPKDCLEIVNKYLDIIISGSSDITIVDCHRYGTLKDGIN